MVREHKPGALHRQLGIPQDMTIPFTLLEAIGVAPIGTRVKNPTQTGDRFYKVTELLKARAAWALNLKRDRKARFRQTGTSNVPADRPRPALSPGRRRSQTGTVYYERRRSHSDRSQRQGL